MQIFVAPNKVVFMRELQQKRTCKEAKVIFKDVHYKNKNLAEESRYTFSLLLVALICSCGKR